MLLRFVDIWFDHTVKKQDVKVKLLHNHFLNGLSNKLRVNNPNNHLNVNASEK